MPCMSIQASGTLYQDSGVWYYGTCVSSARETLGRWLVQAGALHGGWCRQGRQGRCTVAGADREGRGAARWLVQTGKAGALHGGWYRQGRSGRCT
eukprot:75246-Chlamydomonas_euryale.AAC.1